MAASDAEEFEALLDAALGISASQPPLGSSGDAAQQPTAGRPPQQPAPQQPYSPPGSPAYSDASMQMHASPPHQGSMDSGGLLLYSPVRAGSCEPDAYSPTHAARHDAAQQQDASSLAALPREVQMRVLCCLSADALSTLAQTCQCFAALCCEPVLWRRLWVHRWGKNVRQGNAAAWKAAYMERDRAEVAAAGGGGNAAGRGDALQAMFVQAHLAQRHKTLPPGAIDDLMLVEDDDVAQRVMAWRRSHGFACSSPQGGSGGGSLAAAAAAAAAQPDRPADLALPSSGDSMRGGGYGSPAAGAGSSSGASMAAQSGTQRAVGAGAAASPAAAAGAHCMSLAVEHQQSGQEAVGPSSGGQDAAAAAVDTGSRHAATSSSGSRKRRWTQIGHVFCDNESGLVHVCDETCSEKIIERASGLLVCPISGLCTARLLTCAEEDEEEGDRDAEKEHREEEFGGERGRLSRAFAEGYYCETEQELLLKCGVRLPR